MVPAPQPDGVFDGTLEPTVDICVWSGTECSASLEIFTPGTGPGSEIVRVVPEDELYIVNWHTEDLLETWPLEPGSEDRYRIRVLVGTRLLGYADVEVTATGREFRNVETGEYIPLLEGRTLPIKFRIEEGFDDVPGSAEIAAGFQHTCAVDQERQVWCWGSNAYGQLGTGTVGGISPPRKVLGGHAFASVTTSSTHSCALTVEGTAYCWGRNFYGQLGADVSLGGIAPAPVPVQGGHRFSSVSTSVSGYTTCGVTREGGILCWGYGRFGQMGSGTTTIDNPVPVPVSSAFTFKSVTVGATHVCGLTVSREGYCWGSNVWGQIAQGPLYQSLIPTKVSGLELASLDAGYRHTCGLTPTGDAWCWGYNGFGEVGQTTLGTSVTTPLRVPGGVSFDQLSAGGYLSCALQEEGAAWCWGMNLYGSTGTGTPSPAEPLPVPVAGNHHFVDVDAGYAFACGLSTTSEVLCWGLNSHGQVGDPLLGAAVPAPVPSLRLEPGGP